MIGFSLHLQKTEAKNLNTSMKPLPGVLDHIYQNLRTYLPDTTSVYTALITVIGQSSQVCFFFFCNPPIRYRLQKD